MTLEAMQRSNAMFKTTILADHMAQLSQINCAMCNLESYCDADAMEGNPVYNLSFCRIFCLTKINNHSLAVSDCMTKGTKNTK